MEGFPLFVSAETRAEGERRYFPSRFGESPVIVCPDDDVVGPPGEAAGVPPGGGGVPAPGSLGGLGGGPFGTSACG